MSKLVTIDCPRCQLLLSYSPSEPVFGCPNCRTIIEADTLFLDLDSINQPNDPSINQSVSTLSNLASTQSMNRVISQALSNNQPKNFNDERVKNACPSVPLSVINQSVNRSISQAINQSKLSKQKPTRAQIDAISRSITQTIAQSAKLLTHDSSSMSQSSSSPISQISDHLIQLFIRMTHPVDTHQSGLVSTGHASSQPSNKQLGHPIIQPVIQPVNQSFKPPVNLIELCSKCEVEDLESKASVFCAECNDWLCDDHARIHQRKTIKQSISQSMTHTNDQMHQALSQSINQSNHTTQTVAEIRADTERYRRIRLQQSVQLSTDQTRFPTCVCDAHYVPLASQSINQSSNQSHQQMNTSSNISKKKSHKHNRSQSPPHAVIHSRKELVRLQSYHHPIDSVAVLPVQLTRLQSYCMDCHHFLCQLCTSDPSVSQTINQLIFSKDVSVEQPVNHSTHRVQLVADYYVEQTDQSSKTLSRAHQSRAQLARHARVIEQHHQSVNQSIDVNQSMLIANVHSAFARISESTEQLPTHFKLFGARVRSHFDGKRSVKQSKLQSVRAANQLIHQSVKRLHTRIAKMDFNRIKQSTCQLHQLLEQYQIDDTPVGTDSKHQRKSSNKPTKSSSNQLTNQSSTRLSQSTDHNLNQFRETVLTLVRSVNQLLAYTTHWRSVMDQQIVNHSITHQLSNESLSRALLNGPVDKPINQSIIQDLDAVDEDVELSWSSLIRRIKSFNQSADESSTRRTLPETEEGMYAYATESIKTVRPIISQSLMCLVEDLLYISADPNGHLIDVSVDDWEIVTSFIARYINLRSMLQNRAILIDQLINQSLAPSADPFASHSNKQLAKKSGLKHAVQQAIANGQHYLSAYESYYRLINQLIKYTEAEISMFVMLCETLVNLLIYHRPNDGLTEYESPTDELSLREILDASMEVIEQYNYATKPPIATQSKSKSGSSSSHHLSQSSINPVTPLMYQAASRLAWSITGNQMPLSTLIRQPSSPSHHQSSNPSLVTNLRCISFCERCEPVDQLTRLFKNNPSVIFSLNHLLIDSMNDSACQLLTKNLRYLTQLKELRLTFLVNLSINTFAHFCENLRFLTELARLDLDLSETSIKLSTNSLIHCKYLERLNLSDNCLSDPVLNDVLQSINQSGNQSLKHLVLRACDIDEEGYAALARFVPYITQLTHLDLANNSPLDCITCEEQATTQLVLSSHQYAGPGTLGFLSSIHELVHLVSLNLESCGIDASGCCLLAGALTSCRGLETITLYGNPLIDQDATLDTDQARDTSMDQPIYGGFHSLCETLTMLNRLQSINLSCCLLDSVAISKLDLAIRYLPDLHTLELEYCQGQINPSLTQSISESTIQSVAPYQSLTQLNLFGSLCSSFNSLCFPVLRSLDVSHVIAVSPAQSSPFNFSFPRPSSLHSLYFSKISLLPPSVFTVLPLCTQLQCLDLSELSLSASHCDTLANILTCLPHLCEFDCGGNAFDEGCLTLLSSLCCCVKLQKLSLCNVGMNSYAAVKLASCFPSLSMLRTLDLSDNELGSFGCIALTRSFHFLPGLTCFRLSCCGISDEGAAAIMANLHKVHVLRELDLKDNRIGNWMTASIRELIQQQFPQIECILEAQDTR